MQKFALMLLAGTIAGLSLLFAAGGQSPSSRPTPEKKAASPEAPASAPPERDEAPSVKRLLSGKVTLLVTALKERKIATYEKEIQGQVVLVTRSGELVPILPDWRGRAFYQDERLRDRPVDLVVNHRPGIPWVQVLSIYTFDEAGVRQITDYWCDICAIPMYEIKDCECCQGPIRLRVRPQELPADLK